ncbi:MAG: hypothetical protein RLZZ299_540 [Pseudomonadota bacterium]
MLALISLLAAAHAADPVVHAGADSAAVLARVAATAGVPVTELRAVTLPELVQGRAPVLLGGGKLTPCTAAASNRAAIEASLDIAKGAILYMEYGSARAALDAAIRGLGCLQEPVEPSLAARAWYLLGIVAHASSDQATSRAAFRQARLFQPDMTWDPNYPPAAQVTFDAVAAEMRAVSLVSLAVVPEPPEGAVRIDGRPVKVVGGTVAVSPGAHHVQVGAGSLVTVNIEVDANAPATLLLPQFVTQDALRWAGDGDRRAALTAILSGSLGNTGSVFVVSGDVLWRVRLGGSAWDFVGTGASVPAAVPVTGAQAVPATPVAPAAVAAPAAPPAAAPPAPTPAAPSTPTTPATQVTGWPPPPKAPSSTASVPASQPAASMPAPAAPASRGGNPRVLAGNVTAGAGALGFVVGGLYGLGGYRDARDAYADAVANGRTQAGDLAYTNGRARFIRGAAISGVGAALLAGGLVVRGTF